MAYRPTARVLREGIKRGELPAQNVELSAAALVGARRLFQTEGEVPCPFSCLSPTARTK